MFARVLFNACEDLSLTPEDSQQQPALQDDSDEPAALGSDDPVIQRANRHFIHLAEEIPEFGGIYLKVQVSKLVIRVTELDGIDQANVEQFIRNYISAEAPGVSASREVIILWNLYKPYLAI